MSEVKSPKSRCSWCGRAIVVKRVAHRNTLPDGSVELWHRSCWENHLQPSEHWDISGRKEGDS